MRKQKSYYAKSNEIERKWVVIDAENCVLGRLASKVAALLRGKDNPKYTPSVDTGSFVVIYNAEKVAVTGNKVKDKKYYTHSRYPGGLKEKVFGELIKTKPEYVVYEAIRGMIPHTKLGRRLITKLKIYSGPDHPHQSQQPVELDLKRKEKELVNA
jgi:large subunit ribosomal protein L13